MNVLLTIFLLTATHSLQQTNGLMCYSCVALKATTETKVLITALASGQNIILEDSCQSEHEPGEELAINCANTDFACAVDVYTYPYKGELVEFTHRSCQQQVHKGSVGNCEEYEFDQIIQVPGKLPLVNLALLADKEKLAKMRRCSCSTNLCNGTETTNGGARTKNKVSTVLSICGITLLAAKYLIK